ncbi:MAG: T9SS type A sorting domain-containing protein [Flavobacteriales bacterium]|nr:T9SS type A sorting domain-containing protein [Flavobacteriales bacterium]
MKTIYLLLAFVLLYTTNLKAQQWDTITSFSQKILDLKSFNGSLYIGGNFTKNEGNNCYWSAYYNGTSIFRHTTIIGGGGVDAFDVFDNELYAVGSMQHFMSIGVSKWDGSTWVNGGSTNYSHSTIYADGNDLYVESDDGVVRKKTIGGSFQPFYDFNGSGGVGCIMRYNSQLIFAGSFDTINGVAANNIAQWDGVNWTPLGSGISSGAYSMVVFNNELYVAGDISTAGGLSVNKIAKWDGSNWSDVGGGMTGSSWNDLWDMTVFSNALYVVGDFTEMGNVTTHDVARWDGTIWSQVDLPHTDAFVTSVEVYNNNLYVGTFDFDTSHVFVYTGSLTKVNEPNVVNKIDVFPNPVLDNLNIELELNNPASITVEVVDLLGNIAISKKIQTNGHSLISLDCSRLAPGTYIVAIRDDQSNSIYKRESIIVGGD